MSKIFTFLLGSLALIVSVNSYTFATYQNESKEAQYLPVGVKLCLEKEKCLFLEVAKTKEERSKGLMHRKNLNINSGMYFLLNKTKQTDIWMKNVLIPLDIIFIKDRKVMQLYTNLNPCTDNPCKKFNSIYEVDKIIELNSGVVKKYKIEVGQILNIEMI